MNVHRQKTLELFLRCLFFSLWLKRMVVFTISNSPALKFISIHTKKSFLKFIFLKKRPFSTVKLYSKMSVIRCFNFLSIACNAKILFHGHLLRFVLVFKIVKVCVRTIAVFKENIKLNQNLYLLCARACALSVSTFKWD